MPKDKIRRAHILKTRQLYEAMPAKARILLTFLRCILIERLHANVDLCIFSLDYKIATRAVVHVTFYIVILK